MDCMQSSASPRAGTLRVGFQYRKRYGLHAIILNVWYCNEIWRFNTASGMDCMQLPFGKSSLMRTENGCFNTASGMDCMQFSIIINVLLLMRRFQYRKRYGLHAMATCLLATSVFPSFNTASGMDCMQCGKFASRALKPIQVSIPQAVWIACNEREDIVRVMRY